MNQLSVKLNLSFGQLGISADKVLPQHQETLQKCIVKIFHDNVSSAPVSGQKVQLHLGLNGKPILVVGGREIDVKPSSEVKKVERIFRYYQNVLPRQPEEGVSHREQISSRSVRAVSDAAVPGTTANLWAGTRFGDDSLSLYRRIVAVRYGPDSPFSKQLGYYAGSIWSAVFWKELIDGINEHERAKAIGDTEGSTRAWYKAVSGGALLAASLCYLAGKVIDEKVSLEIGAHVLSASSLLFCAGSLVGIITSALGVVRCERFNNRLSEYLQNPNLTEVERMRGAWTFLKDSLVVSAEEKEAFEKEVEAQYDHLSPETIEKLIRKSITEDVEAEVKEAKDKNPAFKMTKEEKKALVDSRMQSLDRAGEKAELVKILIKNKTEAKIKYMKRRTSTKSLQLILGNADEILAKLNSKSVRVQREGVVKATQLIDVIQKENRTKMLLYAIGTIASIISFIGLVCMPFTAALFPFVLCGIASSIYLALAIYYWAPSVPKLYHWIRGDAESTPSLIAKERFAS